MKESDILYEKGPYWICAARRFKGFEVMKNHTTYSIRVASIGFEGEAGMARAKAEIDRRMENAK